jgi:hypothetical protein
MKKILVLLLILISCDSSKEKAMTYRCGTDLKDLDFKYIFYRDRDTTNGAEYFWFIERSPISSNSDYKKLSYKLKDTKNTIFKIDEKKIFWTETASGGVIANTLEISSGVLTKQFQAWGQSTHPKGKQYRCDKLIK